MADHTPGPWWIVDGHLNRIIYGKDGADNTIVAEVHWWVMDGAAESSANARLIAAAPDLLKAAQRALVTLKAQGESVQPTNVLGALSAAVAKAGAPTPSSRARP